MESHHGLISGTDVQHNELRAYSNRLKGVLPPLLPAPEKVVSRDPRTKRCTQCGRERSLSDFSPHTSKPDGLQSNCKLCRRLYRLQQRGARVTLNHLELLSDVAACEICGRQTDNLHLDHCHSTGNFRGFLCSPCNRGLGDFRDDPAVLERAIAYLGRVRCEAV